jgi:ABC-2 type transport system ATP-binding protein
VNDITLTVRCGIVAGFLGPNGARKCTTMRMIVGPDRPTHGLVTVNGRNYPDHASPFHEVGARMGLAMVLAGREGHHPHHVRFDEYAFGGSTLGPADSC